MLDELHAALRSGAGFIDKMSALAYALDRLGSSTAVRADFIRNVIRRANVEFRPPPYGDTKQQYCKQCYGTDLEDFFEGALTRGYKGAVSPCAVTAFEGHEPYHSALQTQCSYMHFIYKAYKSSDPATEFGVDIDTVIEMLEKVTDRWVALNWKLFPLIEKVNKDSETYYVSWVKRSTVYYAGELLLRLKAWKDGSACIGCMSARGPESAQFIGRKVVHECRSQIATGRLHRCALLKHMKLTTARWSIEVRQRSLPHFVALHCLFLRSYCLFLVLTRNLQELRKWTAAGKKEWEKGFDESREVWRTAAAALDYAWPEGHESAYKQFYQKDESDLLTAESSADAERDAEREQSTTHGAGADSEELPEGAGGGGGGGGTDNEETTDGGGRVEDQAEGEVEGGGGADS